MSVAHSRSGTRETVRRERVPDGVGRGSSEARDETREPGPRRCWCGCADGARRSEKTPERMRATVDVIATMLTCVAAEVGGEMDVADEGGG